MVLPSSYEEAADYLEETKQQISVTSGEVKYSEGKTEFGVPDPLRSDDFGEPIKEREDGDTDEEVEIPPVTEPDDTQHYGIPDEEPLAEADLTVDSIEAAVSVTTETSPHYPRTSTLISDDALYDDDMESIMS